MVTRHIMAVLSLDADMLAAVKGKVGKTAQERRQRAAVGWTQTKQGQPYQGQDDNSQSNLSSQGSGWSTEH